MSLWDNFWSSVTSTGGFFDKVWPDADTMVGQSIQSAVDRSFPDADTIAGQGVAWAENKYTTGMDYVNRAISAGNLFTNPTSPSTFGSVQESWRQGDNISAGQSVTANPLNILNPVGLFSSITQRQVVGQFTDFDSVDVTDERVRKAVFEDDTAGSLQSGLIDAAVLWFTDPLVITGKAVKVGRQLVSLQPIRTVQDNRRFVQGIVDSQAHVDSRGVQGRWTPEGQLIQDLTAGTVAQNAQHPFVRRSTNRGALAHLTGESKDFNEVALIVRAAANDQNAISYLWETRASIADALDTWKGLAGADAQQMAAAAGSMFNGSDDVFRGTTRERVQQLLDSKDMRPEAIKKADKGAKGAVSRSEKIEDALLQNVLTADEAAAEFVRMGTNLASAADVAAVQRIRGALQAGRITQGEARSEILSVMHSAREAKITRFENREKLNAIVTDLKSRDAYLRRFEDDLMRNGMAVGSELTTARYAFLEKRRGARARRKADSFFGTVPEDGAGIKQTVFQRNPAVRAVRFFTWHPLRERQSGYVHFAGANMVDADKEIMAAIDQTPALTAMAKSADPAVRAEAAKIKNELINKWYAATYDVDRMKAVEFIEKRLMQVTGASHQITDETAMEIMAKYSEKRRSYIQELTQHGYAVDPVTNEIIQAPQLISQLAESVPIMDFRYMDKLIRENKTVLSRPRTSFNKTRDVSAAVIDEFYAFWRPAVLLRLGYTQRNVLEGNLRAVAAYGFIPSLLDPVGTLRRMGTSYANDAKWAGGQVGSWASPSRRTLRADIESEKTSVIAQRQLAVEYRKTVEDGLDSFVDKSDHLYDYLTNGISRNKLVKLERAAAQAALADPSGRVARGLGSGVITAKEASSELLSHASRVGNVNLAESVKRVSEGLRNGVITEAEAAAQLKVLASQSAMATTPRVRRAMKIEQRFTRGEITEAQLRKALEKNALRSVPGDVRDASRQLRAADLELKRTERTLASLLAVESGKKTPRKHHARYGWGAGEAFDGGMGRAAAANASASRSTQNMISDPMAHAVRRRSNKISQVSRIEPVEVYKGKERVAPKYFDALLGITERQMKNDPVARMLLDGRTDKQIMRWINSKDAHMWRRQMARTGIDVRNPAEHVANLRGIVEYYYPTRDIRRAVLDRSMSVDELKQLYSTIDMYQLPTIHGRITKSGEVKAGWDTLMSSWEAGTGMLYQILGTLPEDILVRHRFYAKIWQDEVGRLTALDKGMRTDLVTDADRAARRLEIERAAHRTALRATRETLYTIERESNLTAKLRWIAPFFAAQENTLRVWLGIALRDPSVIARAQLIYDAPNRAGLVVDEDGNEIPPASLPFSSFTQPANMKLPIPDRMAEFMFGGARPMFSKQSVNVVLQGTNPIAPGVGPPGQMLANVYFRDHPEALSDMKKSMWGTMFANMVLPFGNTNTDETWKMVLPAWVDKVWTSLVDGSDSKEYMNFYMMQAAALKVDIENGEIPRPKSDAEFAKLVEDRTNSAYLWRAVANLTLPMGVQMDSKHEWYVQQWRKIQQEEPDFNAAWAKFSDMYPKYVYAVANLSSNPSGMNATRPAMDRLNANEDLVRDLAIEDPALVALVTNPLGMDDAEYDAAIYNWQYDRKIIPSDPNKKFRTTGSPQDAFDSIDVRQGWKEFSAMKLWFETTVLPGTGYTSVSNLPDDLSGAWQGILSEIGDKYPAWKLERGDMNKQKVINKINKINKLTLDESFMRKSGDPELWGMVSQYMTDREYLLTQIKDADKAGDTELKALLRETWAEVAAQYVESNTKFSYFYDRWLDYDPEVQP